MKHNVLVIGGTGKTGSRVVERLNGSGHQVRIGSRKSNPAFDWDDPASYTPALKGMDRAYIVYYPDLAVPGARKAIEKLTEAALKEGLEKVVLLSGKGEQEAEACEPPGSIKISVRGRSLNRYWPDRLPCPCRMLRSPLWMQMI
jgi:nucleoside-diphosphate-sugar epimerase